MTARRAAMAVGGDHGERLARLEEQRKADLERDDARDERLAKVEAIAKEFHDLLLWARGVNWVVVKVGVVLFGAVTLFATGLAGTAAAMRIFTGH